MKLSEPVLLARRLRLVAIGEPNPALLAWLGPELDRRFGTTSEPAALLPLRAEWRDAERDQFCSNSIVDALVEHFAGDEENVPPCWALGVAEVDLYAPERAFVFGEATLRGCCALISTARLLPRANEAGARSIFRARVLKEAVHELGHVAGLPHCPKPACVMFPSDDLADTDEKETDFCAACKPRLRALLATPRA